MVHTEFHLEPTERDIREMREALDGDEIFLKIAEDKKLFAGMLEIKRIVDLYDDVAELSETTKRTAYARKLQARLEGVIEILNQDEGGAHLIQAMARMRDMRGLASNEVVKRVANLQIDLRDLLRASKQARPRKKDLPPPTRPPKALAEVERMVELLESLGVEVGVTGGEEGGPATRLMIRIHAYVSRGEVIRADAIKDRLKRLKEWNAGHPDWKTRIKRGRGN
jgi:hypothetical protein